MEVECQDIIDDDNDDDWLKEATRPRRLPRITRISHWFDDGSTLLTI